MVYEDYDEPRVSGWIRLEIGIDVNSAEGNESLMDELLLLVRKRLDGIQVPKGVEIQIPEIDMWNLQEDDADVGYYNAQEDKADARRKYNE